MSLKNDLINGSIALPQPERVDPEPAIDMGKVAIARYGEEVIVTHLSVEYLARQFAGTFFEMNRSKRFRSIWGTSDKKQDYYIDKNWTIFHQAGERGHGQDADGSNGDAGPKGCDLSCAMPGERSGPACRWRKRQPADGKGQRTFRRRQGVE